MNLGDLRRLVKETGHLPSDTKVVVTHILVGQPVAVSRNIPYSNIVEAGVFDFEKDLKFEKETMVAFFVKKKDPQDLGLLN